MDEGRKLVIVIGAVVAIEFQRSEGRRGLEFGERSRRRLHTSWAWASSVVPPGTPRLALVLC